MRARTRCDILFNMEWITSAANPVVRGVKKLKDAAERRRTGLFTIEGVNLIKDLPEHLRVERLFVSDPERAEHAALIERFGAAACCALSDAAMKAVSDTVTPCGVLAVVRIPQERDFVQSNVVVCDGISDPGNLGTILRTCVACGIEDVVLIGGTDPYAPKAVRASMGAIFRVSIHRCTYERAQELLHGYEIYSLDMDGENVFSLPRSKKPFALTVGSEAHGISDRMRVASAKILSLPMVGEIESLNAGIALSVGLYALTFGGGV